MSQARVAMPRAEVELKLSISGGNIPLVFTAVIPSADSSYGDHAWRSLEIPLLTLGAEGTQCDAVKNPEKVCRENSTFWSSAAVLNKS